MYRELIPRLADRYRVIAPDLPGFGAPEVPEKRKYKYTFDALAATVAAFTEAIKIDRYAIYVFDYGAPTGFRLAMALPERITGIVSQNGNAYEEDSAMRGDQPPRSPPSTHAHTLSRYPAAAITSGSVINGPTPIISNILKSTAARSPMRRSSVPLPPEVEEVNVIGLIRSPDCTLTESMLFADRSQRFAARDGLCRPDLCRRSPHLPASAAICAATRTRCLALPAPRARAQPHRPAHRRRPRRGGPRAVAQAPLAPPPA